MNRSPSRRVNHSGPNSPLTINRRIVALVQSATSLAFFAIGLTPEAQAGERPAHLAPSEIRNFDQIPPERRRMLEFALETASKHGWLKYQYGSSDPANGGFDCSGSIYYVLKSMGKTPPRTSAQQYHWLLDAGHITRIPKSATSFDDPSFSKLQPGDLLFWSGTYKPTDSRKSSITHVQMYLGIEKATGTHLMIGASNGRTYKGKKQNGYGVFEFRLPRPESTTRFVGYGNIPGL